MKRTFPHYWPHYGLDPNESDDGDVQPTCVFQRRTHSAALVAKLLNFETVHRKSRDANMHNRSKHSNEAFVLSANRYLGHRLRNTNQCDTDQHGCQLVSVCAVNHHFPNDSPLVLIRTLLPGRDVFLESLMTLTDAHHATPSHISTRFS